VPAIDELELRAFAERVLRAAGLAEDQALATAEGLTFANLRGVDSHGLVRLPQYTASIRESGINPAPSVRIAARDGATALVDADGGYGFAPTLLAADTAVELARRHRIGLAGVRDSHHFGMGATYVLRVAEAGFVGWLTTTSAPVMAPTGGASPLLGNNPIAFAIPRRPPHPPIVLDMALSEVAYGRIRLAVAEGRPIPPTWALDAQGRPTTDAQAALAARLLAPVGGYKGYGLAVISEVLAGVLTGSPFAADAAAHGRREGGVGHVVLALDPAMFVSRQVFDEGIEALVDQIKAVPLAAGADEILLPGEPEQRTLAQRRANGVPVSPELASVLEHLAGELAVAPPVWTS
jgi:LDH2 family malate/lactate/ureidoglycolate dehydrogenase